MWVKHNENPSGRNVGDCTVRAISTALGQPWARGARGGPLEGVESGDIPSPKQVGVGEFRKIGFQRAVIPDECPDCYTVADFAAEHPNGTYILALSGHVVCIKDGNYYDTWDSGGEVPLYYWHKEE